MQGFGCFGDAAGFLDLEKNLKLMKGVIHYKIC
jgi:hypothetical protein